jgi:hypothetical protein
MTHTWAYGRVDPHAKPKKGADVKYYECEGLGHLARECPIRLRREKNSRARRDSRSPSERSELNPGNPHENRRASSFFLSALEMAADFHTASLWLRQGKPKVRVKIRGVNREFIVVSGSGVSLIKPGMSRSSQALPHNLFRNDGRRAEY